MRLQEQKLWDTFRDNAPKDLWMLRVENSIGEGMADVWACAPGGIANWIELKAPTRPKKRTTRLLGDEGLRVGQINFHTKAAIMGLETWVLIRDSERYLFMVPGEYAPIMNEFTTRDLDIISVASTWGEVYKRLYRQ